MSDTVLVALIGAVALITQAWIQRGTRKDAKAAKEAAQKTVEQTEHTSNGFAKFVREQVAEIPEVRESLRQVHRRLDSQNAHTARRDDHLDTLLVKFDDRLTQIEDKL